MKRQSEEEKVAKIVHDINEVTLNLEEKYPELYQFMEENPETIPRIKHPKMDENALSDYLQELKHILKRYQESH